MMMQATMLYGPRHLGAGYPSLAGALQDLGRSAATVLQPLFRTPQPEDMPDDIRRLLEEGEVFDDAAEERPCGPPKAGWAPGLAFCIPSLTLIGLLYSLLK